MRAKRGKIWMAAGVMTVAAAGLAVFLLTAPGGGRTTYETLPALTVLTVDGYPVMTDEFQLFLKDERALTVAHFAEKYGAQPDSGFWTRDFDGQTPMEYARDAALAKLLAVKTEDILLHERGLLEEIGFAQIVADMEKKNADQAAKLAAGQPVYGMVKYDLFTYYWRERSNRRTALLTSQIEQANPPEAALRTLYEENRDLLGRGTEITIEIAYEGGGVETETFSEYTISKEDMEALAVWQSLSGQQPGARLDGVFLRGRTANVTLLSKNELGGESFEDAHNFLVRTYAEEQLRQLIAKRQEDARLVIDRDKWDAAGY